MTTRFSKKGIALSAAVLCLLSVAGANDDFTGRWKIDTSRSSALDPWRTLDMEISIRGSMISITRFYAAGRRKAQESMTIDTSLPSQIVTVEGWWDNRHIGAYLDEGDKKIVAAKWLDRGRTLQLNIEMVLETSQGSSPVRVIREMRLSPDGKTLRVLQLRSSRNLPVVRVFTKT